MNENQSNIPLSPEKKKKKRGCCIGCFIVILVIIAAIIGLFAYYWYQSIPKKSPVEKEYNTIPDYFEN